MKDDNQWFRYRIGNVEVCYEWEWKIGPIFFENALIRSKVVTEVIAVDFSDTFDIERICYKSFLFFQHLQSQEAIVCNLILMEQSQFPLSYTNIAAWFWLVLMLLRPTLLDVIQRQNLGCVRSL